MSEPKRFEIRREVVLPATPEQVFQAVTDDSAAWLFPIDAPEPRVGGKGAFGSTVTAWDPPNHYANRVEADGWFNALECIIEAADGGTAVLRYVHSGIFADNWDTQYDGASRHTDLYLRTLSQYLRYFFGRPVTYVAAEGPAASSAPGGLDRLKRALGLTAGSAEGDTVQVEVPGVGRLDAEVDYLTEHFVGLRTGDALYRFYGRNAFGGTVDAAHHLFGGVEQDKTQHAWQLWLDGVYA